jgi:hypothetical protein
MKKCDGCGRNTEHLGLPIKTVCCEKAKASMCKDCCIKNSGYKCHHWSLCWFSIV